MTIQRQFFGLMIFILGTTGFLLSQSDPVTDASSDIATPTLSPASIIIAATDMPSPTSTQTATILPTATLTPIVQPSATLTVVETTSAPTFTPSATMTATDTSIFTATTTVIEATTQVTISSTSTEAPIVTHTHTPTLTPVSTTEIATTPMVSITPTHAISATVNTTVEPIIEVPPVPQTPTVEVTLPVITPSPTIIAQSISQTQVQSNVASIANTTYAQRDDTGDYAMLVGHFALIHTDHVGQVTLTSDNLSQTLSFEHDIAFTFELPPAHYRLVIEADNYISIVYEFDMTDHTHMIPRESLIYGDFNQDRVIDLNDINHIIADYGQSSTITDINQDGIVDIRDVALVSRYMT